ncbi:hypothetical protein GGI25_002350 [Coemansia spiralis]|uniref:J domain-containing protein n=2 Tax=Coemansia TaxID=4863 RepID=A0A9W8G3T7_9FUNG|nr:DnaJ domain-containing protein [Coemansia spiralis]KAJ1990045.1 hypothetical protein EDC05_004307 [Coemansia umbellata]KAJ2622154.1 hypothetical protein GGI26_003449 [Coemansia sp. RSA 1358]KAJ2678365.1 hypothetical protein GGI25_002350 [Coemansia spiralis]
MARTKKQQQDYYEALGVRPDATTEDIRSAYMKRAVRVHPDRNPSPTATEEFQELADAYYVLSDTTRRRQYDSERDSSRANAQTSFGDTHANADNIFGDVFEDMLRPEVGTPSSWWSTVGMVSGGTLGFILANLPGAVVGGFAGKKLGAIRDRTGRPVYDSFKDLPHARKVEVLGAIAAQILGTGMGGPK